MQAEAERDAGAGPPAIAIVGMGGIFPGAASLKEFWRLLRRGEDAIAEVPETHWRAADYYDADPEARDKVYCTRGGFLPPTPFDPTEWGIPPTALEATDTAQLLALVAARAALEDAGYLADPRAGADGQRGAPGAAPGDGAGRQPAPATGAADDAPEGDRRRLRTFDRERTSVICGVTGTLELALPLAARLGHPKWRAALREAGVDPATAEEVVARIADSYVTWQENSFPGLLGNVVAGRIANRLNLGGTNCVVDAACASSLSALHLAVLELQSGRAEMVVCGGSDTLNDPFMFACFARTMALSASGEARPFADDADGTVLGEAVGMLVLKRLADAQRDGDRIYAVIRGIGTSSDGRSQSIYAPRSAGQARALRSAYAAAGVSPATVGLVEAHGTGTKVGDVVEFEALARVFREAGAGEARCALGSVKSQIGHTKAAAGVAGLIKAVLALHHRVLPPTLKVVRPNPKLELSGSPFYLNTRARPWFADGGRPRRAGVSSFGFGGSNFHVVLEEPIGRAATVGWDGSVQIVALSGETRAALRQALEVWQHSPLARPAGKRDEAELAAAAAQSRATFRAAHPFRVVLVVERGDDLRQLLENATRLVAADGSQPLSTSAGAVFGRHAAPGGVALLFPGQGSQYPEMGRDLATVFPELRRAVARAAGAEGLAGLPETIYPRPTFDADATARQQRALMRTEVAQPAIGAVSVGMLGILRRFGMRGDFAAGHSFGELVALHAGGRIDEGALHELARLRGRLMAELGGERGGMLAVHAALDEVSALIAERQLDVIVANENGPSQCVLSGSSGAIEEAQEACRRRGFATTRLAVAAAFHSPLVADAAAPLRAVLEKVEFAPPVIPVYGNTTGGPYPEDADAAREMLANQLARPVRFVTLIRNLYDAGARTFVEVGPGAVLSGLVRSILGDRPHAALSVDASAGRRCGVGDLARVLASLAAAGHEVDLAAWEPDAPAPRRPAMNVPLVGANYRAPRSARRRRAGRTSATRAFEESGAARRWETTVESSASRAGDERMGDMMYESRMSNRGETAPAPRAARFEQPGEAPSTAQGADAVPAGAGPAREAAQREQEGPTARAAAGEWAPGLLRDALDVVSAGVRAMQSLQERTAALHERFLEGQELAQRSIQQLIESQHRLLERAAGGAPLPPTSAATGASPERQTRGAESGRREPTEGQWDRSEPPAAEPTGGAPSAPSAPSAASAARGQRAAAVAEAPCAAPTCGAPLARAEDAAPETGDVARVLLEVVSELTGYPSAMLNLDMDMEADLGIDSIKRVEILATLEQRAPQFTGVNPEYMGGLRTLRQILEYVGRSAPVAAAPPSPGPTAARRPAAAPVAGAGPGAGPDGGSGGTRAADVGEPVAAPLVGHGSPPSRFDLDEPDAGWDAALTAQTTDAPRVMFTRRVDLESHAFLESHVLAGRPVLPLAVIVEWLGHAALHENPGLRFVGWDALRVLRGVVLDGAGLELAALAGPARRSDGLFAVDAELRATDDDAPRARATIVLAPDGADAGVAPCGPVAPARRSFAGREGFTMSPEELYRDVLFHGPHFEAIEQVAYCDEEGIAARLRRAPTPQTWMRDPLRSAWLADPLILDGCWQLGLIWCERRLGAPALPACVGRLRQYAAAYPGRVRAVLRVREAARHRLSADVELLDDAGRAIARMEQSEWTVDPGLRASVRRRRIEAPPA